MLENEILKEADVIKVRLIRWLQHHNDSDLVLGNEVLYSTRQRRADLLMIKNQLLYAFEIKSEKDKVDRLDEQLEDYLSTFDFVYLVSTQKIKRNLKQALPKNVGFISIDHNNICVQKKAKRIKRHNKRNLAEFLDRSTILKLLPSKNIARTSIFDLRDMLCQYVSGDIIHTKSVEKLYERYKRLYELFLFDTLENEVTVEDLRSLTGNIVNDKIY